MVRFRPAFSAGNASPSLAAASAGAGDEAMAEVLEDVLPIRL